MVNCSGRKNEESIVGIYNSSFDDDNGFSYRWFNINKKLYLYKKCLRFLALTLFSTYDFTRRKDTIRLKEKFPQLRNFNELANKNRQILKPYYKQYISEVSNDSMTISFELSVFLMILCNIFKPKSILDLGSGFSSFIFRHYMLNTTSKTEVWSVDDSHSWLEKTRQFLTLHNLPIDNLITWSSFLEKNVDTFDFVLYDLGSTRSFRIKNLNKIVTLVNPNGVIILDDVHDPGYRPNARRVLKEFNLDYYSLKFFTRDKGGRHSWLVFPVK